MIYKLTKPYSEIFGTESDLDRQLLERQFIPCGERDVTKYGWGTPLGKHGSFFTHTLHGYTMICARRQDKVMPASAINELVAEKVEAIQLAESRGVGRKERMNIKEEVVFDMTAKSPVKSELIYAYISRADGLLVVNTGSASKAEQLISFLRETIGSVPVVPLSPNLIPVTTMTDWVLKSVLPFGFDLGSECRLLDPSDAKCSASFSNTALDSEDVVHHIKSGMYVSKLGLAWTGDISFVIDDHLVLRKIKFGDVHADTVDSRDAESVAELFDAEFAVMTLQFSSLFKDIITAFGGEDSAEL